MSESAIELLFTRRIAVQKIIADQTAILDRIGPMYNAALSQLETAHATLLEIDSMIGISQQLLIDAENKLTGVG